MVQSASTMSSVAAAIMANAAKEREETKRIQQQQAAANAQLRRPDQPEPNKVYGDGAIRVKETNDELDQFATSPVRDAPSNAAKASKRGPTQRELQDRRYGPGGREGERERRFQAREDAAGRNAAAKAKIKKRNEENRVDITKGRGYGGSRELGSALAEAREFGGQGAVDELLAEYFPEYAEQQASGMKMNPTQAERRGDQRRNANRRANNKRDFRETFGQDASSLRNRFGDDAPALMRQRLELAESRVPSYDIGGEMPEGFHNLRPDIQGYRVRRGQDKGRFTDAEMAGLLAGGDVGEITSKPRTAMRGALGQETPFEEAMRLSEQGRTEEMGRVVGAGGQVRGNVGQQGVGRPEDALTMGDARNRANVAGSALGGLVDYGGYYESVDRITKPARDKFMDGLGFLFDLGRNFSGGYQGP